MIGFMELAGDYTLRTVALGAAILGIVSGTLGSFAMLRKQSLLGDAISHAALPGIAIAFLLTGSKSSIVLLLGAAIAGWIGTFFVMKIVNATRVKEDSALGLVLSVFFGFGLVLLTLIQKMPNAAQAGLDKFLFGQAATLMTRDVVLTASIGLPVIILMALFWKEMKLMTFDKDYAAIIGIPVRRMEAVFTFLLVIAIVLGLQTVGVVLMSAMVVAPAAAARQWTDRLGFMVILAAIFGAISGATGAVISSLAKHIPTGPTIVLALSLIVLISVLFAPNRGIIWSMFKRHQNRGKLQLRAVLEDLYHLAMQHDAPNHAHSIATIRLMAEGHGGVDRSLQEMKSRGWVTVADGDHWALTESGFKFALAVQNGEEVDL